MAPSRGPRWLRRLAVFLAQDVWSADLEALPFLRRSAYRVLRVAFLAGRGFVEDRCLFRASGLAYITVLSLVPLLAFCFSAAKGLGAYEHLMGGTVTPFLDRTFGAGGPEASELRQAVDKLFSFVDATDVGKLGAFGLAFLAYTVIKLLGTIERAFNDIWGIHGARSFVRKISDYLSLVVVVPILLASATAAAAALQSASGIAHLDETFRLGPVRELFVPMVPLLGVWVGFAFLYLFMPNTRTRIVSSAIGGVAGGTLWFLAQALHVRFQIGMANYNALYSGFAAFPIFLLWIYVSWIAVLFGAEFAFSHQNQAAYRQIARSRHYDHAFREVLAIRVLTRIGMAFRKNEPPRDAIGLADELAVTERSVREVLSRMEAAGLVAPVDESFDRGALPARDLANTRITDVLDAIAERRKPVSFPPTGPVDQELDALHARFEGERAGSRLNLAFDEIVERALEAEGDARRPEGWKIAPETG